MSEANGSEQNNANESAQAPGASDGQDNTADLQKYAEQNEKLKNDYLYLRAEFENYKKQAVKERSDLVKFGPERLVRDLLGILDNFERALSVPMTPDNFNVLKQGVEMTANELRTMLGRHGVTELKGEGAFDPNIHEAISAEASEKVPAGNVLRVFQKAYKLHDKLIRPAQVVVAKKPE